MGKTAFFIRHGGRDFQLKDQRALPRLASKNDIEVGRHSESLIFQERGINLLTLEGCRVNKQGTAQKVRRPVHDTMTDIGEQCRNQGRGKAGAKILGEISVTVERKNADLP
jgi:hypothetical protein